MHKCVEERNRVIRSNLSIGDSRIKENQGKGDAINKKKAAEAATDEVVREVYGLIPASVFLLRIETLIQLIQLIGRRCPSKCSSPTTQPSCRPTTAWSIPTSLRMAPCNFTSFSFWHKALTLSVSFNRHSVQRKLSLVQASMDLLYAKVNMYITTCVLAGEFSPLSLALIPRFFPFSTFYFSLSPTFSFRISSLSVFH